MTARPCGTSVVQLLGGVNRIRLEADALSTPDSITLRRAGAAGSAQPPTGSVDVIRWADTRRDIRVATTAPAYLSVTENANAGWSATLDGKSLTPVTLDGWHQGWLVPAGSAGVVHLVFTPQRLVDWGLVLGALAILGLLACALVRPRRDNEPVALRDAQLRTRTLLVGGVLALAGLGGLGGVLIVLAVLVARDEWHYRWRDRSAERIASRVGGSAPLLAAVLLLLAGAVEALGPAGSARAFADSAGVQVLCLLAVSVLVVGLLPTPAPRTAVTAKQRPLDEVVRRRSDRRRGNRGEREQGEEVATEDAPVELALDEEQQR